MEVISLKQLYKHWTFCTQIFFNKIRCILHVVAKRRLCYFQPCVQLHLSPLQLIIVFEYSNFATYSRLFDILVNETAAVVASSSALKQQNS